MKAKPDGTESSQNTAYDARRAKAREQFNEVRQNTIYLVLAEVLFVLLPFLAIGTVFFFKGKFHELSTQPEWALAAAVISGQAIVKCISGFWSSPDGKYTRQKISLWITLAIVFSLTPSLLVLTLILNGEETKAPPALIKAQIFFFFIGLVVFITFNWLGENIRARAKFDQETASARRGDATQREPLNQQLSGHNRSRSQPGDGSNGNREDLAPEGWKQRIEDRVVAEAGVQFLANSKSAASSSG